MIKALSLALAFSVLAAPALAQSEKIVVGYTATIDFLTGFVAADEGYFRAKGLDVTFQRMPNGAVVAPSLVAGSLQIGGLTEPQLLQAVAGGLPLKLVSLGSIVTPDQPNGWIMVREGSGITQANDLVGKNVAAGAIGSFYQVLLREWLARNGVDPDKVNYLEVPFPQIVDALRSGQVVAATVGEPFVSKIIADHIGHKLSAYTTTFDPKLISLVYAADADWLKGHQAVTGEFKAALDEAAAFIPQHPDEARRSAAKYLGFPLEVLANIPFAVYSTDVSAGQFDTWNAISRRQGLLDQDVPLAKVLPK